MSEDIKESKPEVASSEQITIRVRDQVSEERKGFVVAWNIMMELKNLKCYR
jgi:hypothetical protein